MCGSSAPAPPPAPDYAGLAKQQHESDIDTAMVNAKLNRVDQYNPYGSKTYEQDPNDPMHYIERTELNPELAATLEGQELYGAGMTNTGLGLMGRAQDAVADPFSLEGMTKIAGYNPEDPTAGWGGASAHGSYDPTALNNLQTGFGGVKDVQEAMMGQLQPGIDQQRAREIQRLKAQGLTENSEQMNNALFQQGRVQNDASQRALLASLSEYNTEFNRGIAKSAEQRQAATLADQLRANQIGEMTAGAGLRNQNQMDIRNANTTDRNREISEALMMRAQPLQEAQSFMTAGAGPGGGGMMGGGGGGFSSVPSVSVGNENVYQAGKDAYADTVDRYNAAQAGKGNKVAGALGGAAAGAKLGTTFGPWGTAIGGILGGAAGYFGS